MASFSKTCKRMDLGDISARRILISKARVYDGISIGRFEPGVGPSKRAQTRNSLVVATLTEYGMVTDRSVNQKVFGSHHWCRLSHALGGTGRRGRGLWKG
jgi:hypothetical protein